jgi:radical SAM superfamily enzyme YgiQ (UPF0313 family)
MSSLLLILPADNTYRFRGAFLRSYSYAPLTLTTLAALVPPESEYSIDLMDEGSQRPVLSSKSYDLVGITCVTSSALRAYELCRYWHKKGAYVVLGGAHPTLLPQEAALHADTVIVGPAEQAWPAFLRDFRLGRAKKIYMHDNNIPLSHPRPVPRRDLIRRKLYLDIPTVIARPGCSNHCEFCTIPSLGQEALGNRSVEEVVAEIAMLGRRRILFLDPNLTGDRQYAKKLFEALVPLRLQWAGLASIDIVRDEDLLRPMVESGCAGLLIGFESLNQENLTASHKHFACVAEYSRAIQTLRLNGVIILGCFVLGFDHDTRESLEVLPDLVEELRIDLPRYSILTPFPGSGLFKTLQREKRILTTNWSLYDTEHVVFRPAHMEPDQLQRALHSAWHRSYRIQNICNRSLHLKRNRFFGVLANLGLRHYGKRLNALQRTIHGTLDPH